MLSLGLELDHGIFVTVVMHKRVGSSREIVTATYFAIGNCKPVCPYITSEARLKKFTRFNPNDLDF